MTIQVSPTTYKIDILITVEFHKQVSIQAKSREEALEILSELGLDDLEKLDERAILDNWEYDFSSIDTEIDGEKYYLE